ncbi:MAG: FHA domain-containing protein [Anaerolineales bacterium]|nr:FHA domain-containing protein [Anaerolineales bacterium]
MLRQDDVKKLLVNHNRRLQKLKEQQALQGISVDPKILIEIEDIEAEIEELQQELKELENHEVGKEPRRVPRTSTEKKRTTSRIRLIHVTSTGQHSLIESNDRLIAIGRASKNHVQIPEQEVSWEHGQIILMQGSYYYCHLSKSNPSILRRRGEEYLLRAGGKEEILLQNQDRLTIGNTTFIIEFDLINEDTGYTTTAKKHEDT